MSLRATLDCRGSTASCKCPGGRGGASGSGGLGVRFPCRVRTGSSQPRRGVGRLGRVDRLGSGGSVGCRCRVRSGPYGARDRGSAQPGRRLRSDGSAGPHGRLPTGPYGARDRGSAQPGRRLRFGGGGGCRGRVRSGSYGARVRGSARSAGDAWRCAGKGTPTPARRAGHQLRASCVSPYEGRARHRMRPQQSRSRPRHPPTRTAHHRHRAIPGASRPGCGSGEAGRDGLGTCGGCPAEALAEDVQAPGGPDGQSTPRPDPTRLARIGGTAQRSPPCCQRNSRSEAGSRFRQ